VLLIAALTLCALWALGVLVVVGLCRDAARGDGDGTLAPAAGATKAASPNLRLIA
jgi:hypothetical protein